jgi:hypothetical protein
MKGAKMVEPAIKEIQRRPGVKMEAVCDMVELSKTTIGGKTYFRGDRDVMQKVVFVNEEV